LSHVSGSISAGKAITLGDSAKVDGSAYSAINVITFGAGATVGK